MRPQECQSDHWLKSSMEARVALGWLERTAGPQSVVLWAASHCWGS